jgi:hypothetical protein
MQLHSIPRRSFNSSPADRAPINWRRGMFRVWILTSVAWIMSWAIYLIMYTLGGRTEPKDFLVIPVLLFGPPVALLIFGAATAWSFRGFKPEEAPAEEQP